MYIHIAEMLSRKARMYPDEIVAVVIELVPRKTLTEEEVLDYCQQIPRHKRPRKVFFGEILRSPTGKIEKQKLRKRYIVRESYL